MHSFCMFNEPAPRTRARRSRTELAVQHFLVPYPTVATAIVIDQRAIAPRERSASAFSRFAALLPGQALQLLNDHDPQPLRTQFARRCLGQFTWTALQAGPPCGACNSFGSAPCPPLQRAIPAAPGVSAAVAGRRAGPMTFVVTEACVRCKYTDCNARVGETRLAPSVELRHGLLVCTDVRSRRTVPLRKARPFARAVSAVRPGWPATRRQSRRSARWRRLGRRPRAHSRGSCRRTRPRAFRPAAPRSNACRWTLRDGCRGRRRGGRGRRSWCAARLWVSLRRSLHGIGMLLNKIVESPSQGECAPQDSSPICDCSQFCSPTCATRPICVSRWSMCSSVSSRMLSSSSRDT